MILKTKKVNLTKQMNIQKKVLPNTLHKILLINKKNLKNYLLLQWWFKILEKRVNKLKEKIRLKGLIKSKKFKF